MPMRISPTIDTDPGRITTMFPRMSPIANSLSPATQSDILEILQREQDHAVALLSSSPLLTSLFVSYANQAAALESVTSSTESEEWKALENTISSLREDVDRLKPENIKMAEKLEAGAASLEAFRSQVASLKKVNATQEHEIDSLRAELIESKDQYDRLWEGSNAEKDSLLSVVSNLEIQRAELKETVVEQQLKLAKLERQVLVEREEKGKAKQETKHSTHHEMKRGGEERDQKPSAPTILSAWGLTAKKDNPPKEASSLSPEEQKQERGGGRGVGPTEKKCKKLGLHPIDPPSVLVGLTGGEEATPLARKDPSGSAVEVKIYVPDGDKGIYTPSDFSAAPSPVISSRVVVCSENERFTDEEQGPSPTSPRPAFVPEVGPEASPSPISELEAQQRVKEEVPTTPKPSANQSPIPASIPATKPRMFTKPIPQPPPTPARNISGWGSWGSSLLNNVAAARLPERSPSPEPAPIRPRIEDPPRGFTPRQPPPKAQPAGFEYSPACGNPPGKPARGSTGPAWGEKPTRGNKTDAGIGGGFVVDTLTKPSESGPSTPLPEGIPELSESLLTDEEAGTTQGVSSTLSTLNTPDLGGADHSFATKRKKKGRK